MFTLTGVKEVIRWHTAARCPGPSQVPEDQREASWGTGTTRLSRWLLTSPTKAEQPGPVILSGSGRRSWAGILRWWTSPPGLSSLEWYRQHAIIQMDLGAARYGLAV